MRRASEHLANYSLRIRSHAGTGMGLSYCEYYER